MDLLRNDSKFFLAKNIRLLRKKLHLSQEELANNIGLSRGNIASYERGSAEPKICNLLKLAHFFDIRVLDLTNKDLRTDGPASQLNGAPAIIPTEAIPVLEKYQKSSEEIREVLDSLNCYHCYKKKSLDDLPKDMQIMVINFEKLFEVTQALMASHNDLIGYVKSQCPPPNP